MSDRSEVTGCWRGDGGEHLPAEALKRAARVNDRALYSFPNMTLGSAGVKALRTQHRFSFSVSKGRGQESLGAPQTCGKIPERARFVMTAKAESDARQGLPVRRSGPASANRQAALRFKATGC